MKNFNTTEMMSVEQLNLVAGGSYKETSADTKALLEYDLVGDNFSKLETIFHWGTVSDMVDKGWAKAGISCITNPFSDNEYKIQVEGKYHRISRGEALLILKKKFGAEENAQ